MSKAPKSLQPTGIDIGWILAVMFLVGPFLITLGTWNYLMADEPPWQRRGAFK